MNAYCISVPNQKIILILQRQGDERILFGTMDIEKRRKERQGINNTILEWKLVPIIRQREEKKSSTFAASLEKW